jgi:hypothetical protein
MKTSSCKAKGRLGQQEVVKILLEHGKDLNEDDIRSTPMGSQGEDVLLSYAARRVFPWNIEVKRGKAFNLVKACKQAEARSKAVLCTSLDCNEGVDNENFDQPCCRCKGTGKITYTPVAIGRYDHDKKWYATVELDYLLLLISK